MIPLGFYFIQGAFGVESLAVDILLFFVAVVSGFIVLNHMLEKDYTGFAAVGSVVLLIWAACFIVFTFSTLHLPIFYDTRGGFYGIVQ